MAGGFGSYARNAIARQGRYRPNEEPKPSTEINPAAASGEAVGVEKLDHEFRKGYIEGQISMREQANPAADMAELSRLSACFPELNLSNYGPDDVDALNGWAVEVVQEIDRLAANPAAGAEPGVPLGRILRLASDLSVSKRPEDSLAAVSAFLREIAAHQPATSERDAEEARFVECLEMIRDWPEVWQDSLAARTMASMAKKVLADAQREQSEKRSKEAGKC